LDNKVFKYRIKCKMSTF